MAKHNAQVVFDGDEVSLACEELERCREALLTGLVSYGEIERLSAVQSWCDEKPINPKLRLREEHQDSETVVHFAHALRYVDVLMRKMRAAKEVQS
ncbi:MAG: hypothetical protein M3461_24035 [Pseudomonadota bacterium]|nr:hypothetical protein [Pseudomonadota bacterium]